MLSMMRKSNFNSVHVPCTGMCKLMHNFFIFIFISFIAIAIFLRRSVTRKLLCAWAKQSSVKSFTEWSVARMHDFGIFGCCVLVVRARQMLMRAASANSHGQRITFPCP